MKHCNVLTPQQNTTSPKPAHACIDLHITLYEQGALAKCSAAKYENICSASIIGCLLITDEIAIFHVDKYMLML